MHLKYVFKCLYTPINWQRLARGKTLIESCEIEVISTGDEIVFGQLVDTNSAWIAKLSTEQGARVRRISCIGDQLEDIVQVIQRGISDGRKIVVMTGGLGPSEDDLTVEALAKASKRKVIYDKIATQMLETRCTEFAIQLTDRRMKMARLVTGASALENLIGLAPGILLTEGQCTIIALPGIPKEMKPMFKQYVLPLISKNSEKKSAAISLNLHMSLKDFFHIVAELRQLFPEVYVKRHAQPPNRDHGHQELEQLGIDIVVWGDTLQVCETKITVIRDKLRDLAQGRGREISEKT